MPTQSHRLGSTGYGAVLCHHLRLAEGHNPSMTRFSRGSLQAVLPRSGAAHILPYSPATDRKPKVSAPGLTRSQRGTGVGGYTLQFLALGGQTGFVLHTLSDVPSGLPAVAGTHSFLQLLLVFLPLLPHFHSLPVLPESPLKETTGTRILNTGL